MTSSRPRQPQNKVHNNSRKQGKCQYSRPKPIIKALLAPDPDAPCTPMELIERVEHGSHGNHGEDSCADLSDFVTEVQEADSQAAEDDGEVEPGEEGTFVGKEDFGFDAGREGNALACLVVS
jgi:hypothetical protein